MNKTTFKRLFKKPMPWNKATGVLLFAKQKMTNGKLPLVAIPFKKYKEAQLCFKNQVRKSANYAPKLVLLTTLEWKKELDGNAHLVLTPIQGKMDLDYAQTHAAELFKNLKVSVEIVRPLQDLSAEETTITDQNKKRQNKRKNRLKRITDKWGKLEKMVGTLPLVTLEEKIKNFQTILQDLEQTAQEDGIIDETEAQEIAQLKGRIEQVEVKIKQQENSTPLTDAQRKKILYGLDKVEKKLDRIIKRKELYLPVFNNIDDKPTKVEQIIQLTAVYRKKIDQVGTLTSTEDKEIERLLARVEQKALLVGEAFELATSDPLVNKLMQQGRTMAKAYADLLIADMKKLVPTALAHQGALEMLLIDVENWQEQHKELAAKQQKDVQRYKILIQEMQKEGKRVLELVNGNQLNPNSRAEYAKVIAAHEGARTTYKEELALLKVIPEEDRRDWQKKKIKEKETRLEVLNDFEETLFSFIENNKVRFDRVTELRDNKGNIINGQAFYDGTSKEFVLELDAEGKASLGAHELRHLVQAKQGKLAFLSGAKGSFGPLLDLHDEVEAYKIQYSINPSSVPGHPSSINDIDADFMKNIKNKNGKYIYSNLLDRQYTLDDTVETLNDHPKFNGSLKTKVLHGTMKHPTTGEEINVWDYYKNWSFKDFIVDTSFSKNAGENPLRTNGDYIGLIIAK